jgi:hypothetical protein
MDLITKNRTENSKGVKPLIHQSELRTYTKVVSFKDKNSFRFVVHHIGYTSVRHKSPHLPGIEFNGKYSLNVSKN